MTPTIEEAYVKFKANEVEAGQQILIRLLNDEPGNDDAWKLLIESYPDKDMQFQLANEYFNLTAGSQNASQTLLRQYKNKVARYEEEEFNDRKWLGRIQWLENFAFLGKIKWTKTFLIKIIAGLVAAILLISTLWIVTSVSASLRLKRAELDFDRLAGVYSDQVLDFTTLQAQYSELELLYGQLQTEYITLEQAYKTLAAGMTTP